MAKETTCHASALMAANTTINVKPTIDARAPAIWDMALTGSLKIFVHDIIILNNKAYLAQLPLIFFQYYISFTKTLSGKLFTAQFNS